MSAWGCCEEYNDHAVDCVWNENNPNSYNAIKEERDGLQIILKDKTESLKKYKDDSVRLHNILAQTYSVLHSLESLGWEEEGPPFNWNEILKEAEEVLAAHHKLVEEK